MLLANLALFILMLFSLYKCFLAYFSISKIIDKAMTLEPHGLNRRDELL